VGGLPQSSDFLSFERDQTNVFALITRKEIIKRRLGQFGREEGYLVYFSGLGPDLLALPRIKTRARDLESVLRC
jgi:hypothetical protein